MKNILFILLSFFFVSAQASNISSTTITRVLVGPVYGNKVFLTISAKPTDSPSCQTNSGYNYVFDASTESGKATLSVALAAHMSGASVWLQGFDNCSLWSNVESLKHIVTNK